MKDYLTKLFMAGNVGEFELEDDEKIIVKDPSYLEKASTVLQDTNKRIIANYLGWRVLKSQIGQLNKAARNIKQDFDRHFLGKAKALPDWKRCLQEVGFNWEWTGDNWPPTGLETIAGSMYIREYFKPEEKTRIVELTTYIRNAFYSMLDTVKWMDEKTKERAKFKLNKMSQFIAYPDEMTDQSIVDSFFDPINTLTAINFMENHIKVRQFHRSQNFKQLREKVDPRDWTKRLVAAVNAFYHPNTNIM